MAEPDIDEDAKIQMDHTVVLDEKQVKEKVEEGWLQFRTIIEILGAPKEHIEKTLADYLKKIQDEEEGVLFISKGIAPAEPKDNLFTTFAELELLAKDLASLMGFCFDYMPSSVEIMEPQKVPLDAQDFTDLLNDLQTRLHHVDMEYKQTKALLDVAEMNMGKILQNFVRGLCEQEPKDLPELIHKTGVEAKVLKQVLDFMVSKKFILLQDGKFATNGKKG
ncbi:hypothetical protein COY28_05935 [Candidatus Woesearchaeota archaeon CG_4_10_14_0_2_um_filter_57_5]|nr:MAG: hypothetical protein AUJ68_03475 [Candidatus Woesearchaeota archaeon CG1_02_57_44]PIZ49930.1 MAG: hypothetical protein COY28_05935 [Candidatus Woesearchaeota archaeon CG_4_10_14_0_2_um_filter_57_5]